MLSVASQKQVGLCFPSPALGLPDPSSDLVSGKNWDFTVASWSQLYKVPTGGKCHVSPRGRLGRG